MTVWQNFIRRDAPPPEWPYPVSYGKETEMACDVLVVGGGVAGCRAAISAAQKGAKVIVMERGHVKRSGSGGAGVDHWHGAVTNPCSKVTPLDYTLACYQKHARLHQWHSALYYLLRRLGYSSGIGKMGGSNPRYPG